MKENISGGIIDVETQLVKASLRSVTPLIPAGRDLVEALAFYTEHMGFSIVWQGDDMASIRRDDISFNLVKNSNREWIENTSFSIGVSDLEAPYQEYRQMPAKVGALEMNLGTARVSYQRARVAFQFYQREDDS